MIKTSNIALAAETLRECAVGYANAESYCQSGICLTDSINNSIDNGWIESTLAEGMKRKELPRIIFLKSTTVDAIHDIAFKNFNELVVLNFASAKNPGGGWLRGSVAQEEDLCRHSTLGYVLMNDKFKAYYKDNINYNNPLYLNTAIVTPDILFYKQNGTRVSDPVSATVITLAAPNAKAIMDNESNTSKSIVSTLQMRVRLILTALEMRPPKSTTLILGAWGCGVFKNNPNTIALIFKQLIKLLPYCVDTVVFAIPDDHHYSIFEREFS